MMLPHMYHIQTLTISNPLIMVGISIDYLIITISPHLHLLLPFLHLLQLEPVQIQALVSPLRVERYETTGVAPSSTVSIDSNTTMSNTI